MRSVVFKHAPTHVGVYDNEKAGRRAKAAMLRAHRAVPRTAEVEDKILAQVSFYRLDLSCVEQMTVNQFFDQLGTFLRLQHS